MPVFQKQLLVISIGFLSCCLNADAWGQQVIKVSQTAWQSLAAPEREAIQAKYIVSAIDPESFGMIFDDQGVNESTTGTNGGPVPGRAVANTAYSDSA